MGIGARAGWQYFIKRVPRRFESLDRRGIVRISLNTKDPALAKRKAPAVEDELFAYWEALAAGRSDDAPARYDAVLKFAAARGIAYRPADDLAANATLAEIVSRLDRLEAGREFGNAEVVAAELGGESRPAFPISKAFKWYLDQVEDRLDGKSKNQRRHWLLPRQRAVESLIAIIGDKDMANVDREDAQKFRDWAADRLRAGKWRPCSANKSLQVLSDFVGTVDRLKRLGIGRPFSEMRFADPDNRERYPIPAEWVRTKWLATGALDGLNEQARDALLVLTETGLRPSELLGCVAADIALGSEIPHISISARRGAKARQLKNVPSARDVPLVGIALDAISRHPSGFPRYFDKADSFSAAVNKYLRERNLFPTPAHTVYGLRHAFEDRLTALDCPERMKADLMGHALGRERYGAGPTLGHKAAWIGRIAIMAPAVCHA